MYDTKTFTVTISSTGTKHQVIAVSTYHAIEKVYSKQSDTEPNRSKYSAKRQRY